MENCLFNPTANMCRHTPDITDTRFIDKKKCLRLLLKTFYKRLARTLGKYYNESFLTAQPSNVDQQTAELVLTPSSIVFVIGIICVHAILGAQLVKLLINDLQH